jgi:hypothetical protein
MSKTCDVYVKLPHGIIIGHEAVSSAMDGADSTRLLLEHGFNENVPRRRIEQWLAQNSNLAAVKRGDVRIIPDDVIAVDSSTRK